MKQIAFTTDKNGRVRAYVWRLGYGTRCWWPIALVKARALVATEAAVQVPYTGSWGTPLATNSNPNN